MPCVSSLPLKISNPLLDNQFIAMADFNAIGDGDLQAVVRGCTNGFSTTTTFSNNPPAAIFSPMITQEDDFVFTTFPDLFETTTVLDELEELYKPFYHISNPISPQTVLSSSSTISVSGEEREAEKVQEKEASSGCLSAVAAATTALAAKYKRRKTQHKRVVLHVTAEDLSSDTWAWRKYGQKPIKGSPYPRSYYRCSSSKGCLARKQVERSHSDPEMFVITYTAEHCHSRPTRRSSLAGTTRHRFSIPKTAATGDHLPDPPVSAENGGSQIPIVASLSPPNPLLEATKEDEFSERVIKEEEEDEQQMDMDYRSEHNELVLCDMNMILSDDFLGGFDEIHRLTSDQAYNGALRGQFPMSFPC
ncbi:WRKY Transcription Factor [Sarracenia purpurea var. burkii]